MGQKDFEGESKRIIVRQALRTGILCKSDGLGKHETVEKCDQAFDRWASVAGCC
jgi:hypothetical protein